MKLCVLAGVLFLLIGLCYGQDEVFDYVWSTYWTSLSSATTFYNQNFTTVEEYWGDVVYETYNGSSFILVPVTLTAAFIGLVL